MVALVKRVERFLFTEVPRRGFPRRSCGAERRVRQALLTRRSRRKRASLLPWRSSENPQLPPGLRPRRSPPAAAPDPQSTALCDQVIGQLATIGSGDDLGRLEPL